MSAELYRHSQEGLEEEGFKASRARGRAGTRVDQDGPSPGFWMGGGGDTHSSWEGWTNVAVEEEMEDDRLEYLGNGWQIGMRMSS